MKNRIELNTLTDVNEFVHICSELPYSISLTDGNNYRVSAKSMLGACCAKMDWAEIYVECERDIYLKIKKYIVE